MSGFISLSSAAKKFSMQEQFIVQLIRLKKISAYHDYLTKQIWLDEKEFTDRTSSYVVNPTVSERTR